MSESGSGAVPYACGCVYVGDAMTTTCPGHASVLAQMASGERPVQKPGDAFDAGEAADRTLLRLAKRAKDTPTKPSGPVPVPVEALLREAGVLDEFLAARLADFPACPKLEPFLTGGWESGQAPGIVLKGKWGGGKTRYAVAIVAELLARRAVATGTVVLARALRRDIVESYRDRSERRPAEVIRWYSQRPVLVVDDLGHEGEVTPAFVGDLHEILTTRRGRGLRTIVTTNLGLQQLKVLYDGAIESRLAAYTQLTLAGEDRRRPARQPPA